MVQVDISQLSSECNSWRDKLRSFRQELTHNEALLQKAASRDLNKDQLQQVEHLHNQFHIQLINIHDLKQGIKGHDRKMELERELFNGIVNEDSLMVHESLLQEYEGLEGRLQELRGEFEGFLERM